MKKKYSNVRGTIDFSQQQVHIYQNLSQRAAFLFELSGYRQLILPLLEERKLFEKSVGQDTDIVQSQMMQIAKKDVVLRPEATAQIVRYYLQNRLDKKNNFYKFFYNGPMFRGERPQKGRLRQFYHLGAEVVGSDSFYLDAEIIKLAVDILEAVGLGQKELQVNSLGCEKDKAKLSFLIKEKLKGKEQKLCSNCQRRVKNNPLRVVDCKNSNCKEVIALLRLEKKHLCAGCHKHFTSLLKVLDDLGLVYKYNPYLVRGLDYYTNTVFEITSSSLGSQDALGAGGRYNGLFSRLGGLNLPAVGFALGIERVMLALGDKVKFKRPPLVFLARAGKVDQEAFLLLTDLRKNDIISTCDFRHKSLKAQLRYAQKIGADFVVIVGEQELEKKEVVLKDMHNSKQEKVKLNQLVKKINLAKKAKRLC